MSSRPLSQYKTAPDVPVLVWESPMDENEDALLVTTVGGVHAHGEPLVYELRKTAEGKAFPMGITVGRMPNNDVRLDSRSVSRFHAYFVKQPNGDWQLVDAQSKLGTLADGVRAERTKPVTLKPRSRLKFGEVAMLYLTPPAFADYLSIRSGRK